MEDELANRLTAYLGEMASRGDEQAHKLLVDLRKHLSDEENAEVSKYWNRSYD